MMGFGFLGLLILGGALLALLGIGAGLISRQASGTRSPGGPGQSTVRQTLDERLARGDLNRDEYDRVLARIEQ